MNMERKILISVLVSRFQSSAKITESLFQDCMVRWVLGDLLTIILCIKIYQVISVPAC